MKLVKSIGIVLLAVAMTACSEVKWEKVGDSKYFEIEVPDHMESRTDLNSDASLQYGYVASSGTETLEHYVIVLMETKEEIASYDLGFEFDARSYWDITSSSLGGGLNSYEIITPDPKIKTINGMDAVTSEMRGSLGVTDVYYMMGVFEGEKAFYQVLTWTIEDQKDQFKEDMEKIINSMTEI